MGNKALELDLRENTVLLVEDNPTNLQVLYKTLDNHHYKLLIARSGEDALSVIHKAKPQLVLLDIMMPGIDGYEVCRQIKAEPDTADIAVIFLSALDDPADKVKGLSLGAVDYIAKPFKAEEIIARVETHLSLYQLKQQLKSENLQLQARQAQLLQAMGEGVIAVDANGKISLCNQAAEKLLGFDKDTLLAQGFSDTLQHSDEAGQPLQADKSPLMSALDEQKSLTLESVLWHRQGYPIAVEMTLSPYQLQQEKGAVVVFHDIRQRKAQEKALRDALTQIEQLKEQLQSDNRYLQHELKQEHNFSGIIGNSDALSDVLTQVKQVAETDTTVLIHGESGTGKESIARAIHELSPRQRRPLIKVNCGAIPESLVESELFGHIKGAFTGAVSDRKGHFELADGGTIFLDEFGDLSLDVQVKLLRVLQEQEIQPVGSSACRKIDVRVLAATNRDLKQMVDKNQFRMDLYYRMNVFPITVPPLRERRSDIPRLAQHFLECYRHQFNKPVTQVAAASLEAMMNYHWPGNIRELQNVIERSVILASGQELIIDRALLEPVSSHSPLTSNDTHANTITDNQHPSLAMNGPATGQASGFVSLADNERQYILQVLGSVDWMIAGKGGAADILDLPPSTLRSRMKKLGISRP